MDRKGRLSLATSVDADTVYAVPSEIGDPDVAVAKLCAAFRDCTSKERQSLTERCTSPWCYSPTCGVGIPNKKTASEKKLDDLDGISFVKESRRFSPEQGALAAHVLSNVHMEQEAPRCGRLVGVCNYNSGGERAGSVSVRAATRNGGRCCRFRAAATDIRVDGVELTMRLTPRQLLLRAPSSPSGLSSRRHTA